MRRERRRESKFDQKEADLPSVAVPLQNTEPGMPQQDMRFSGPPPESSIDTSLLNRTAEP